MPLDALSSILPTPQSPSPDSGKHDLPAVSSSISVDPQGTIPRRVEASGNSGTQLPVPSKSSSANQHVDARV